MRGMGLIVRAVGGGGAIFEGVVWGEWSRRVGLGVDDLGGLEISDRKSGEEIPGRGRRYRGREEGVHEASWRTRRFMSDC